MAASVITAGINFIILKVYRVPITGSVIDHFPYTIPMARHATIPDISGVGYTGYYRKLLNTRAENSAFDFLVNARK